MHLITEQDSALHIGWQCVRRWEKYPNPILIPTLLGGDLLTNYNGTAISYDSIGNPTNWICIAALYWDGRELDSITMATNHMVDYTYNSDGIRTKKYEYNGNGQYLYDHNYVLDGSKILKETILYSSAFNGKSTITLEYYYDESGIASFRYNGTVYHYIKNLQGDVIGIVNSNNGGIVVEYTYDAWGNILSVTGSLASTVGQANPFRYRSYYYDTDFAFHYSFLRHLLLDSGRNQRGKVKSVLYGFALFQSDYKVFDDTGAS